jgi:hypothetical protein
MKFLSGIIISLLILLGITGNALAFTQAGDSTIILNSNTDTTTGRIPGADTIFLPSRKNHIFTSISSVYDPFISTKFLLGFGVAELIETEIPVSIPGYKDTVIKFQPDIFYATGGAEFQFAVRNWAAVNIKVMGLARMGNNFLSLASEGVSAASLFSIGWLFRIVESQDVMFSGSIALSTADIAIINVLSREDTTITPIDTLVSREVISNHQSLTTQADLRFAARLSDVVGILTRLSGGIGEGYSAGSEGRINYNFGLALSFDLRNWFNIPFGVGLGGSLVSNDWQFKETNPPGYSCNLNISFYNRNDFTIGVENYLSFIQPELLDRTFNYLYTKIYMSYYF